MVDYLKNHVIRQIRCVDPTVNKTERLLKYNEITREWDHFFYSEMYEKLQIIINDLPDYPTNTKWIYPEQQHKECIIEFSKYILSFIYTKEEMINLLSEVYQVSKLEIEKLDKYEIMELYDPCLF